MLRNIKSFLLYMIISLILVVIYIEVSHFFVNCGGTNNHLKNIEIPILIILLILLYYPTEKMIKNIGLALIPILGLYILYDVFYSFLARSARYSDLENIFILQDFSLLLVFGLLTTVVVMLSSIIYLVYNFYKRGAKRTFFVFMAAKIILILCVVYILNSVFFNNYLLKKFNYYSWSQARTIKKNGRFSSFLYYGIKSKEAREKLIKYKSENINVNQILYGNLEIKKKRNIYIVILESFIDPRLIKNIDFTQSPIYKGLKKYLYNGEFSHLISPVYGGGTAQPEFEVLTGVRALAKVNSIEFNVLDGGQISGFVDVLKRKGYHTYASIATYSSYFNSKIAYKSIGFDDMQFLEECSDFKRNEDDKKIFDGDMYDHIVNKLKNRKFQKPHLIYALGMYGHFPYDRNLNTRPDVTTVSLKDKRINRIANQFYYRTKALTEYIKQILAVDPNSVIYVSSDHIPPILDKGIEYKKSKYTNIAFLLLDGKPIDVGGYHYYDIPRLIYKTLVGSTTALKKIDEKTYKELYFKTLSESL